MSELIRHVIMFYKYGGKQLYYFNTADGAGEIEVKQPEVTQSTEIDNETCDSCTI
jgi:hypothetical protein